MYRFEITFSTDASNYAIEQTTGGANGLVGCKVVQNLQYITGQSTTKASCYIAFEDQRGTTPKFTVVSKSNPSTKIKDFKFPFIQSIKGLTVTLSVNPPTIIFPLCATNDLIYVMDPAKPIKYKRADNQAEFGNPIPYYEYLVPKGWTVNGQVSDGTTGITTGANAAIRSDKINAGDNKVKIRGSQTGTVCHNVSGPQLIAGTWLEIPISRPTIKLTSGGLTSPVSVRCGYETTKTFVLEQANQASCITQYVWNLGANNGWKYNGIAAQPSIPINGAANNSLTLTSYCNQVPSSSVSVTAYAGAEALGTYTIPVTYDQTPPIPSITGPTTDLCTSDPVTYTVAGTLPCNAVVNWSVSPAGILSIAPNGSSVTVTPIGDGNVQLQATITSCGQTSFPSGIAIKVGRIPTADYLTIDNVNPATSTICRYTESMIIAHPAIIEQDVWYEWNLPSDWNTLENGTPSAVTQDYMLPVYPGSDGTIYVRRFNQCGYSNFYSVFVEFDPWCGNFYSISPNPATSNITVDGQKQKKNIKEIQILDKTGQIRRVAKFGNNQQRVNLNISGLAPDIYYIKIFDGKEWKSKPIRVQ